MNRNTVIKCDEYRKFVKAKPCCVCGRSPVDFDHLKARGRGEGKRNDLCGIPLCRTCHMLRGQYGDEKFQTLNQVNLWLENSYLLIEFFAIECWEKEQVIDIEFGKTR